MLDPPIASSKCCLLAVPPEIRQLVFAELFRPLATIHIIANPLSSPVEDDDETSTSWSAGQESLDIARHDLQSQLLATCKQMYAEGLPFLYSQRYFDLTARESLKLLLRIIGPQTFSNIRHVVLDWDSLQDFAWSISKPGYDLAFSGLDVLQMATWRNRHLRTTGTRWKNVKGYERTICQAAADIIHKHRNLRILVEEVFVRKSSITQLTRTVPLSEGSDQGVQVNIDLPLRVKWRFLTSLTNRNDNEAVVDIDEDLRMLRATEDEATEDGFHLPMMDPF